MRFHLSWISFISAALILFVDSSAESDGEATQLPEAVSDDNIISYFNFRKAEYAKTEDGPHVGESPSNRISSFCQKARYPADCEATLYGSRRKLLARPSARDMTRITINAARERVRRIRSSAHTMHSRRAGERKWLGLAAQDCVDMLALADESLGDVEAALARGADTSAAAAARYDDDSDGIPHWLDAALTLTAECQEGLDTYARRSAALDDVLLFKASPGAPLREVLAPCGSPAGPAAGAGAALLELRGIEGKEESLRIQQAVLRVKEASEHLKDSEKELKVLVSLASEELDTANLVALS
eukprot:jgi/Mesen1/1652/ME000135S00641